MPVEPLDDLTQSTVSSETMYRSRNTIPRRNFGEPSILLDLNINRNGNASLLVEGREMIRQQIGNTLMVLLGMEHFEDDFGSLLPLRVFDPAISSASQRNMSFQLEGDVIDALSVLMNDKIIVLHSECQVTALEDEDGYAITVSYEARQFQLTDKYEFRILKPR